jgi:hypothetical protein
MGIFTSILSKLGIGDKPDAAPTPAPTPTAAPAPGGPAPSLVPDPSVAVPLVDVVAKFEAMAEANPQKLNWRTSIVDLLKLLDLDSSFGARKELAVELECPAELMKDSASMNIWLHKTVLAKIAANGGYIPHDLY